MFTYKGEWKNGGLNSAAYALVSCHHMRVLLAFVTCWYYNGLMTVKA